VWIFGETIDTDVMFPGFALRLPVDEASAHLFESIHPGWAAQVQRGDIVVAGRSFGVGSARPVASLLRFVGIQAVLAESMSSLFQRNCLNDGLLALTAPGIIDLCADGEEIEIDANVGVVRNSRGQDIRIPVLPPQLASMLEAGGVLSMLRRDGYLPSV
jgi:3-isopropylmalate/(R)-2-methylmalate dehydratase small subunit